MFPGTGCVIDGSHMKNTDFQIAVVQLAFSAGLEMDHKQFEDDLLWLAGYERGENDDEGFLLDIYDALDWTYEDALDYLNSKLPDGLCYTVDNQSLFLEELDD